MTYWHYTCDHGARGISASGLIVPNHQPLLGVSVVWLTNSRGWRPRALGLGTRDLISCNRTAHCFAVADPVDVMPWRIFRDTVIGRSVITDLLEAASGARPDAWFVSMESQPIARSF